MSKRALLLWKKSNGGSRVLFFKARWAFFQCDRVARSDFHIFIFLLGGAAKQAICTTPTHFRVWAMTCFLKERRVMRNVKGVSRATARGGIFGP